jgi:hypothetical protein
MSLSPYAADWLRSAVFSAIIASVLTPLIVGWRARRSRSQGG